MKPIIETQNVHKRFGATAALKGVSLRIPEGRVTAFLGPNGAGKTTLIKCLLNLHRPDQGTIKILGRPSTGLGPEQFRHIGYVSENQELPDWMTVEGYLDYCRPLYPDWDRDFERKLLGDFDLPLKQKLKNLSRGMRMKAALLSSLAYRPRLVVLDEPFSGLDALVRDEFLTGLLELTEQQGWTVFISSHDIDEVSRLADDVAIINQGTIPLHESSESLLGRFREIDVPFIGDSPSINSMPEGWIHAESEGRRLRFVATDYDPASFQHRLEKALPEAAEHTARAMNLREVFVALARQFRWQGRLTTAVQEPAETVAPTLSDR